MHGQHPKVDLKNLEHRAGELQKNLAFIGQSGNNDTSDLFKIIHFPGWTTILDVEVAGHILDSMNQQAAALRGMRNALEAHVKQGAQR